jgi:hypothetical protein
VAGFKAWLELGYRVTNGQRAIPDQCAIADQERDAPSWRPMDFAVWLRSESTANAVWAVTLTEFEVRAAEAARDPSTPLAGSGGGVSACSWPPSSERARSSATSSTGHTR